MALTRGTRLGQYEIGGPLGSGGMGEVYRARDLRLDREVAIKVLPASFASDADRVMRFEREAKTLATLNHPHIAQIYGLEKSSDHSALVMELVEGEDLAARIARDLIPLDEALAIARQIAEALEAAHDAGIIHRDLKPANIKVRPDGTVKVLDFGLAKQGLSAVAPPGAKADATGTVTSPVGTEIGMILGTAAYMSPEQARGKAVDRRTDIWAFGCVFFEMLAAKRAFAGDVVTETLGAVLHKEPDWSALDPQLPARIPMVLQRCLQKDPRERIHDIADVRLGIAGAFDLPKTSSAGLAAPQSERSRWTYAMAAAAGLLIGGLIVGAATRMRSSAPAPADPVRVVLTTPDDPALRTSPNALDVAISRDGSRVVYVTSAAGGGLAGRALNQLQSASLVQGNEASLTPVISPDGAWVAFNDLIRQTIVKMPVEGGPAITLLTGVGPVRGASWAEDGTIVFGELGPGSLNCPRVEERRACSPRPIRREGKWTTGGLTCFRAHERCCSRG
jgi:eukaryotic-like serine/threonine-protein kinase